MTLRDIVNTIGGDLYAGGRRANVPAPGHSAADRSVSLLFEQGRVVAHCFGEGDWRTVLDDLRRRRLIDALNRPTSGASVERLAPTVTDQARQAAVQRLWPAARPVVRTLAERYLRLRRIDRTLPGPEVARFLPETPTAVYAPVSWTRPALLLAIRDPEGRLSGLEITYLAPNGRRALDLRLSRKTVGQVPSSSAVRIDAPGSEMLVAEGFLTTLSATEHFGLPGWALLSTRNLRGWLPPAGVSRVLIAGDRGRDGEASAHRLRGRLLRAGFSAAVSLPPAPWGDWNDWAGRS